MAPAYVVALYGELDLYAAAVLNAELGTLNGERALLLDMSGVQFIDPTGLRAVVGLVERYRDRGVAIKLLRPGRQARRLFALAELSPGLPFID